MVARRGMWYAACSWCCTGCLYLAPIKQSPENAPPVIISPSSLTHDLVMAADPEKLEVIAYDAELDDLYFAWSVPHNVGFEQLPIVQNGDLRVSVIEVPRDAILDGSVISCTVSDVVAPDRTQVVTWRITVTQ